MIFRKDNHPKDNQKNFSGGLMALSRSILSLGTTTGTTIRAKKEKMPENPASSRNFGGPTRT
jgi:hypothetical protein